MAEGAEAMTKYFRPKEDITAYETAFLLGHIVIGGVMQSVWQSPIQFTDTQWSEVPEPIRRHFVDSASYK